MSLYEIEIMHSVSETLDIQGGGEEINVEITRNGKRVGGFADNTP